MIHTFEIFNASCGRKTWLADKSWERNATESEDEEINVFDNLVLEAEYFLKEVVPSHPTDPEHTGTLNTLGP